MSLTRQRLEEIRREVERIKVTPQVRNTGWWCEVVDTLLAELDRKDAVVEAARKVAEMREWHKTACQANEEEAARASRAVLREIEATQEALRRHGEEG